jgi:hypothetical protein
MEELAGFWSYARDDDDAEGGRITRLAAKIKTEYAMLTGEAIEVFLDREEIAWGEEWRRRIDEALLGTAFFIPVITPRYFGRPECRRELLTFAGHAASLGVDELLLPLLYVPVPDLGSDSPDEAVALVARMQYMNWTGLRLEDENSAEYRKGVYELATLLVEIRSRVAERSVATVAPATSAVDADLGGDDEPGFFEILAAAEEAMPKWQETMEGFVPVMEEISGASDRAAGAVAESDQRGGGFAGRLRVAAAYAQAIDGPADAFLKLASDYASNLVAVDAGMLTLIRMAEANRDDEDERKAACGLFAGVKEFAEISRTNAASMAEFSATIDSTAKFSREVRGPLRKLQTALQRLMDGQAVIDEWVRQIDTTGIDCSDVPPVSAET